MKIFVSYSHEDRRWVQGDESGAGDRGARPFIPWLAQQLRLLGVEVWVDVELDKAIGEDFEKEIVRQINESDFALLLISQDFVSSDFIRRVEISHIRRRVEANEMQVIPILVAPVAWDWNDEARWLHSRQVVPGKPTPLVEYTRDEGSWKKVRVEILSLIRQRLAAQTMDSAYLKAGASTTSLPQIESLVPPQPGSGLLPVAEPLVPPLSDHLPPPPPSALTPRRGRLAFVAAAGAALIAVGGLGYWAVTRQGPAQSDSAATPPSATAPATDPARDIAPISLTEPKSTNPLRPVALYRPQFRLTWDHRRRVGREIYQVQISASPEFAVGMTTTIQSVTDRIDISNADWGRVGPQYWRVRVQLTATNPPVTGEWSETAMFERYYSVLDRIRMSNRIVVGTSAFNNVPGDTMIYNRETKTYSGLDADIMNEVCAFIGKRLGLTGLRPEYENVSWGDPLWNLLRNNEADLLMSGITATSEREERYAMRFSNPYYQTFQAAAWHKESGIQNLAEALSHTGTGVTGMRGATVAEAIFARFEPLGGDSYDVIFPELARHRDRVGVHDYALLYTLQQSMANGDEFTLEPIFASKLPMDKQEDFLRVNGRRDSEDWGIAVSKEHKELLNLVNDALASLKESRTLDKIIAANNYPPLIEAPDVPAGTDGANGPKPADADPPTAQPAAAPQPSPAVTPAAAPAPVGQPPRDRTETLRF